MHIPFEKWHGCKNDFLVIWMISTDKDTVLESLKRLAPKICNRDGSGIGSDGILVIETRTRKDVEPLALHIVNADGSLANNCGNGLRCAAMSVRRKSLSESTREVEGVNFNVEGRSIDCRFTGKPSNPLVAVTMPIPSVNNANLWHDEVTTLFNGLSKQFKEFNPEIVTVSLGNPHLVATSDESSAEISIDIGKKMQVARNGDGLNVHLARALETTEKDIQKAKQELGEPIGDLFEVWPWERGVGPTQACGTGACAVAVAAYEDGITERKDWIAIDMPGGRLYAKQSAEGEPVILAGPAAFVFAGEIEI